MYIFIILLLLSLRTGLIYQFILAVPNPWARPTVGREEVVQGHEPYYINITYIYF
jgi:hypothetical protein